MEISAMTNSTTLQLERRRDAAKLQFRLPDASDAAQMWQIAEESGLDLNSQYSYLMIAEFFSSTSIVAESDGEVAGFVSGFCLPESPAELFVWQIAVKNAWQGNRVGSRMLDELAGRHRKDGGRFIAATINPSNEASQRTFKSLARRLGTECEVSSLFGTELFDGDEHEEEELYRIGPIR
jgi:L-2,4-diaminobutyric acid acetyltransferase